MQPPLATFLEQVLATAQAGLTYSKDPFDIGRFEALREATVALIASHSDLKPDAIAEWIDLDRGYPTPKLDVRALIVDKAGHILLVQERSDGCWTLPGGWCDIGDSPADAVVREVVEETGLECRAVQLLALFDKLKHPHPPQLPHAHKAFFLCEVIGGQLLGKPMKHKVQVTSSSTTCLNSPVIGRWRPNCAPCMPICCKSGAIPCSTDPIGGRIS